MIIVERDYGDPQVVALVAEVQQEYVERYGGPDESVVEFGEFDAPHGAFLIGILDGRPVAMGGYRRLDPDTAELKRMYVVRACRRRGLSRQLLAVLEDRAATAGYRMLLLSTGTEQPEALALYEASGYGPVPGFGFYAAAPRALFLGKRLVSLG